jgi:hypothetical protein
VVGVAEGYSGDAVLFGEGDGAVDGGVGVEVAEASVAVPAFDTAEGCGEGGFGVDVDAAVEDHGFEAGEAVEAVGVDAVAGGFGDEAGGEGGAVFAEAEAQHGAAEGFVEVVVGDSEHGI